MGALTRSPSAVAAKPVSITKSWIVLPDCATIIRGERVACYRCHCARSSSSRTGLSITSRSWATLAALDVNHHALAIDGR